MLVPQKLCIELQCITISYLVAFGEDGQSYGGSRILILENDHIFQKFGKKSLHKTVPKRVIKA